MHDDSQPGSLAARGGGLGLTASRRCEFWWSSIAGGCLVVAGSCVEIDPAFITGASQSTASELGQDSEGDTSGPTDDVTGTDRTSDSSHDQDTASGSTKATGDSPSATSSDATASEPSGTEAGPDTGHATAQDSSEVESSTDTDPGTWPTGTDSTGSDSEAGETQTEDTDNGGSGDSSGDNPDLGTEDTGDEETGTADTGGGGSEPWICWGPNSPPAKSVIISNTNQIYAGRVVSPGAYNLCALEIYTGNVDGNIELSWWSEAMGTAEPDLLLAQATTPFTADHSWVRAALDESIPVELDVAYWFGLRTDTADTTWPEAASGVDVERVSSTDNGQTWGFRYHMPLLLRMICCPD
ncbi:MAG: hypothetical protein B7733_03545 [Myxococcales bacterium FL481]|nr:MAG: hypothetical protein B7733_03545 [Myxococcales bacterium FL481]